MFQPKLIVWLYISPCPFLFCTCSPGTDLHAFHLPATINFFFSCLSFQTVILNTILFRSLACLPHFSISEERDSRRLKPGNVLLSLKGNWRMEYHLVFLQWISFKLTIAQSPFSSISSIISSISSIIVYDWIRHNMWIVTYSKVVQ